MASYEVLCHWCGGQCGGTCLQLTSSTQMKTYDPAYWMLQGGHTSTPVVHDPSCYICRDPEFAQMGLPLCRPCPLCSAKGGQPGHIPADDVDCTVCRATDPAYIAAMEKLEAG